jgi:hypothetical protein
MDVKWSRFQLRVSRFQIQDGRQSPMIQVDDGSIIRFAIPQKHNQSEGLILSVTSVS